MRAIAGEGGRFKRGTAYLMAIASIAELISSFNPNVTLVSMELIVPTLQAVT
jgi:hypothetical protein